MADTLVVTKENRRQNMINTGLRIGRHVAPGGKYLVNALQQALDEPMSAMQIMPGNPHRYWPSKVAESETRSFRESKGDLYVVVHMNYLTNICERPDMRSAKMTRHSLVKNLVWAELHGCDSVVFHPGSPKDNDRDDAMQWAEEAISEVLVRYEGPVQLLLENCAHNGKMGGNVQELIDVCDSIEDDRLGICIDTTHGFAAGYTVDDMSKEVSSKPINLASLADKNLLRLVHFNNPDPGVELGNQRDRHSCTFTDGVFSMEDISKLFQACRRTMVNGKPVPMILEGTPDLPSDLVWLLSWETELRTTGKITTPNLGEDIFTIYQDHEVPADADAIP